MLREQGQKRGLAHSLFADQFTGHDHEYWVGYAGGGAAGGGGEHGPLIVKSGCDWRWLSEVHLNLPAGRPVVVSCRKIGIALPRVL